MSRKKSSDFLSEETQLQQFYRHRNSLLKQASAKFLSHTSLVIKIGIELEFYLTNFDSSQLFDEKILHDFISDLSKKIPTNSLIYKIEKEQGQGQIEVKTAFDSDLLKICEDISALKLIAKNLAEERNLVASFASQQFLNDCGSALQFNISLHDADDRNIFWFDKKILHKTVNALLQKTNEMMIFLAPEEADYVRFSTQINRDLFKKGKFTAPVNLSFGTDNRTCAIRIPAKSKRLEYRIAAANCDPALCMSAILLAILFGIENGAQPINQIHGNAFDAQYEAENFCQNFDEARKGFFAEESFVLHSFLEFGGKKGL